MNLMLSLTFIQPNVLTASKKKVERVKEILFNMLGTNGIQTTVFVLW